jgi:hypothetical protein
MDSKDNTLGKLAIPFNKGTELLINPPRHAGLVSSWQLRLSRPMATCGTWLGEYAMPRKFS